MTTDDDRITAMAKTSTPVRQAPSRKVANRLAKIQAATAAKREHQKGLAKASAECKRLAVDAWEEGATYPELAEALGSTTQYVYKILQPHIAEIRSTEKN